MDYHIHRCSRHCATTGRQLREGEEFYSVLKLNGAELQREDYSLESWSGPPEKSLGWWKSRMPTSDSKKPRLAPSEVLMQLFLELEESPDKLDMRYVMALLLVRRKILRLERTEEDEQGREILMLYSPRDESRHEVLSLNPSPERCQQIEEELAQLLFAEGSE